MNSASTKREPIIEVLQARELREHPVVQKLMVTAILKRIINDFDAKSLGVMHAVYYSIGGVLAVWIVDGQHRLKAIMKLISENKLPVDFTTEVQIHYDINDDMNAAKLFLRLQNRAPIDTFSKFKIQVEAGVPEAIGAMAVAAQYNLNISPTAGEAKITCPMSMSRLWAIDKGVVLASTLGTLINAWGASASSLEGKLIEGLGLVYAKYGERVDTSALVKKLAKYPGGSTALIGNARGMRQFGKSSVAKCIAELIVRAHDTGKRIGRLMNDSDQPDLLNM